jgi:hypothetical protein
MTKMKKMIAKVVVAFITAVKRVCWLNCKNEVCTKRALAKSSAIFKLKRFVVLGLDM